MRAQDHGVVKVILHRLVTPLQSGMKYRIRGVDAGGTCNWSGVFFEDYIDALRYANTLVVAFRICGRILLVDDNVPRADKKY